MPLSDSQAFLHALDKTLWTAADKLRRNLDAAVYKHAVLGLIFLKYVSDSFAQRQGEMEAMKDPENDFFVDPASYDKPAQYAEAIHRVLDERDYYIEIIVFWVPALTRWRTLQDSAKLPTGTEITVKTGKTITYKITSSIKHIDDALEAVEKENPNGALRHRLSARGARRVRSGARIKLNNVLNKNYTQHQIDPANLAGLIDLIASIPFQHADLHTKFILGHFFFPRSMERSNMDCAERCPKGCRGGGINSPWRRGKRAATGAERQRLLRREARRVAAGAPINTSRLSPSSASSWK